MVAVSKKVLVLASFTPDEIFPVAAVDEAEHLTTRLVCLEPYRSVSMGQLSARFATDAAQKDMAMLVFDRLSDELKPADKWDQNSKTKRNVVMARKKLQLNHYFQKARTFNDRPKKLLRSLDSSKANLSVATKVLELHLSTGMAEALAIPTGLECDAALQNVMVIMMAMHFWSVVISLLSERA